MKCWNTEGWPVTEKTLQLAESFAERVVPLPVCVAEFSKYDGGELGIDWETRSRSLSFLIDEDKIYYFFKDEKTKERCKGSFIWNGELPSVVFNLFIKLEDKDEN